MFLDTQHIKSACTNLSGTMLSTATTITLLRPCQSVYSSFGACRVPVASGLGQVYEGLWYPFSHLSMTLKDYAAKAHKDSKDVGMGFITWYFQGDCTSSN